MRMSINKTNTMVGSAKGMRRDRNGVALATASNRALTNNTCTQIHTIFDSIPAERRSNDAHPNTRPVLTFAIMMKDLQPRDHM